MTNQGPTGTRDPEAQPTKRRGRHVPAAPATHQTPDPAAQPTTRGGRRHDPASQSVGRQAAQRPTERPERQEQTRRPAGLDAQGGQPAQNPVRRTQRPRDPEARKHALAAAAIEVIAEAGIGRTTHRAVAARADLPLGATTYYFPTLDALIAAGLQQATETQEADLREWTDRLRDAPDLASALVALAGECLADRRQSRIEYELYVAAARDSALRPLAVAWLDGLHDLLAPRVGSAAARNVSALLDGATLQALVTGTDLDAEALTDAVRRLTTRL